MMLMAEATQSSNLMHILKLAGLVVLALLAIAIFIIIVVGVYQTYRVEHRPQQAVFRAGSLPDPLPDGAYKGFQNISMGADWQGKVFDRKNSSGINQFAHEQRYTFKTYAANGLRDGDKQVLRIDYNQPGNPWWLRYIVDEIVQTGPGKYQGKVHLKIIPGLTLQ